MTRYGRVQPLGSTGRPCWTCTADGWSAGRWPTTRADLVTGALAAAVEGGRITTMRGQRRMGIRAVRVSAAHRPSNLTLFAGWVAQPGHDGVGAVGLPPA